ncbi:hypothetical protein ILUMI_26443 [Ignelater luminosus]|uniref:Chitin-binding type-2 domain-containing protein n=1 Tax=Ignelater luminosus TaxID=2038154 RepID=A0A8K0C3S5_IGNLU|nr:hypothetical protein ILUMI_26443 [Ignelater luminosus]
MKIIFGLIVIVAALNFAYLEQQEWIDYRLLRNGNYDIEAVTVTCTAPGLKCGDCDQLFLCRKDGNELKPEFIENCSNYNQTCNIDRCSPTPTLECALINATFECRSLEGMYPDPGSCRDFHYCIPSKTGSTPIEKYSSKCEGTSFGYNPRTTYCDVPLRNQSCGASIVPICSNPGQTGIVRDNPTLYYMCRRHSAAHPILYPFLYMCPNGKKYNAINYECL